jgi:type II secretory pathway pseudopilin PulG
MNDQMSLLIVVGLTAVVVALFLYNRRQKQKFEAERAARRRKLDQIKADARRKQEAAKTDDT